MSGLTFRFSSSTEVPGQREGRGGDWQAVSDWSGAGEEMCSLGGESNRSAGREGAGKAKAS